MLSFMLAQPRIMLSMARDGYVPACIYSHIHTKYHTPNRSTIINGVLCAVFSYIPYEILIKLVNIGTIIGFTTVCVCVIVLHYKQPNLHRPFRTPLTPFIPICGVLANILLLLQLDRLSWIRYGIWLCIGLTVYIVWGRYNSQYVKSRVTYNELYSTTNHLMNKSIDIQNDDMIHTDDDVPDTHNTIELGALHDHHHDNELIDYSVDTPVFSQHHSLQHKSKSIRSNNSDIEHLGLLHKSNI